MRDYLENVLLIIEKKIVNDYFQSNLIIWPIWSGNALFGKYTTKWRKWPPPPIRLQLLITLYQVSSQLTIILMSWCVGSWSTPITHMSGLMGAGVRERIKVWSSYKDLYNIPVIIWLVRKSLTQDCHGGQFQYSRLLRYVASNRLGISS